MPELVYTPLEDFETIRDELKAGFRSGKLQSVEYRKYQLLQLAYLVEENIEQLEEALKQDLGRPNVESRFIDIVPSICDAIEAYKNLEKWAAPEKLAFSFDTFAVKPRVHKAPKGTVLIISPFNYPIWLSLGPVAGAIAAGNTVLLKPSELVPNTSGLMTKLVHQYLDNDVIRVVNGGVAETTKIIELQWDHILYTGSGRVGRIVATAAAKHLTPVSLELGGKCPVVVDPSCDLQTAAKRILWGKAANAGQTCVAPDYVLVPRAFQDTFVNALKETYEQFYPAEKRASLPENYARLVTPQAFDRVKRLLDNSKGTIVIGGENDEAAKFIAPTILRDVSVDDSLMSEELFGPLLPIVPIDDIDEAIRVINSKGHPLALYLFAKDQSVKDRVFRSTQSGAFSVNEVVIHPGLEGLPFGGVGSSGYGPHTGKYTFDMFSHVRPSIDSPSWIDAVLGFRFPPYTDKKLKGSDSLKPSLPAKPKGPPVGKSSRWNNKWLMVALAVAIAAGLTKRGRFLVA